MKNLTVFAVLLSLAAALPASAQRQIYITDPEGNGYIPADLGRPSHAEKPAAVEVKALPATTPVPEPVPLPEPKIDVAAMEAPTTQEELDQTFDQTVYQRPGVCKDDVCYFDADRTDPVPSSETAPENRGAVVAVKGRTDAEPPQALETKPKDTVAPAPKSAEGKEKSFLSKVGGAISDAVPAMMGAIAGFVLLGPLGALLGLVLGAILGSFM